MPPLYPPLRTGGTTVSTGVQCVGVEGWLPTLWWLIGAGAAAVSEEHHLSPPLEGLRVRALS